MNSDNDGRRHLHVPHEPYEWREPTERQGDDSGDGSGHHSGHDWGHDLSTHSGNQEPKQSHAGNGTVNHGPDDQSPTGLDSDELALRGLLHQVVQEMEPRDGTLDHLRKAVPARRARKRQAVVGMAAAALFIGTAIPALVHVSNSTGTDADPSMAGHYSQVQGGAGQGKGPEGGESTSGGSAGKTEGKSPGEQKDQDKGKGTGSATGSSSGTDPAASSVAGVPLCTAADLGSVTGTTDAADSVGAVYGTFHLTNTSTASCSVSGPGSVTTTPQGAADATTITTARHVAGDAAASLPDPSLEVTSLVLAPGAAYDVKFAWVPSATCPTTGDTSGGTSDPSPDPTESTDTTTTGGTSTGDTGTSTQLLTADGTADGSVIVTNTAEDGSPSVSATVSNACAGTIYWTGVLAGS